MKSLFGVLALAMLLGSTTRAEAGLLQNLLGITALQEAVAELEADVADLQSQLNNVSNTNMMQQSQINALLVAVGNLNGTVQMKCDDIDLLFECKEALDERLSRVEAVVDCQETICEVGGMNFCIDTNIDPNHCGECGVMCMPNENCVDGTCELKPCDPIDECHDATLMQDGTCVQTAKSNDTPCDDGLGCTVVDICQSGVCVGFGTPCQGGDTCSEDGMGGFVCE